MKLEVIATCPHCSEDFDFEYDPDQAINDVDCPECKEPLVVKAWDPSTQKVTLASDPEATCDECGKTLPLCACEEDEDQDEEADSDFIDTDEYEIDLDEDEEG